MTAGEKIKKIRLDKGWSLKELSAKCGIRDTTLRKYENGDRNPKYETLETIAAAFGCRVIDLIPHTDNGTNLAFESGSDFDMARDSIIREAQRQDHDYMQRLAVPALKLNEIGRKVLLDNAESLAANEDMTK